jgi:3-oxoacyl-[acyl-carrier protein] reductase
MLIDLTNKTALICGGSNGIGLAVAKLFAECGCSIIVLGRNQRGLLRTVQTLKKDDSQFHRIVVADLSNPKQISKTFNNFFKKSPVDILLNNSSGPLPKNIFVTKARDFQTVFNQHFLSVHIITQKAVEVMKKVNYGRIINILGTSIKEPIQGLSLSSIKAATANWAKILSNEVGKYNITVNNILPGPTNTKELNRIVSLLARSENISKEEYLKKVGDDTDIGRIATAKEIANVILFVASEYSSFVTGTNIFVDGGYTSSI